MSSARAGAPHVPLPTEGVAGGRGVSRFSTTDQNALGGGFSFLSGSASTGSSTGEMDFLDLNGDGFPDAVGDGKVFYSTPDGGVNSDPEQPGLGSIRDNSNDATNLGIGGNPAAFFANSRGDVDSNAKGQAKENNTTSQLGAYGFAVNASLGGGSSTGDTELLDVNGDNLPDQVSRVVDNNGTARVLVALNLGYATATASPTRSPATRTARCGSRRAGSGAPTCCARWSGRSAPASRSTTSAAATPTTSRSRTS